MDIDSITKQVDKLSNANYYAWKQKIQHLLALKDLDEHIEGDPPTEPNSLNAWKKKDKKASALIGLSLSDDQLDNVRECQSAKEMWVAIQNVFERHTLLNKLSARRKFYTASMKETETVLQFSNRISLLSLRLKAMDVKIDESEMAMALLNGLPDAFHPLISALDALGTEDKTLNFEFVKSRVMQEEQRIKIRADESLLKTETSALFTNHQKAKRRPSCDNCGKLGHVASKCWDKYPHLRPQRNRPQAALVSNQLIDETPVCLLAFHERTSTYWYIDSGCSHHMTFDKSAFSTYSEQLDSCVEVGNGERTKIAGTGSVKLNLGMNGRSKPCIIQNVLHVPNLGYQLLSVSQLSKSGIQTLFTSIGTQLIRNQEVIATGSLVGNLYKLDVSLGHCSPEKALVAANLNTWHKRLGHIDISTIKLIKSEGIATGLNFKNEDFSNCTGCFKGKGHRDPIPKKSFTRAAKLLELIHSDISGPFQVLSLGGSVYFITFIDDFSRWTVVYTMKRKSESLHYFQKFHRFAEKHTGCKLSKMQLSTTDTTPPEKVKTIRTDNGGEYISRAFQQYLDDHGISHQLTVPYTPQQNGVAERMNRTIIDLVRCMIHSENVAKHFWAEALNTAVYVRNRVPNKALPKDKTPFSLWHGTIPDLSHLRVFGSKCWYVSPKSKLKKLDARSREALMMGYANKSKGYKLWDIELKKMIISRDVKFCEIEPYTTSTPLLDTASDVDDQGRDEEKVDLDIRDEDVSNSDIATENIENDSDTLNNSESDQSEECVRQENTGNKESAENVAPKPRRSPREFTKPKEWWKSSGKALAARVVPFSYKSATTPENIDFWMPGIKDEHNSLERNKTWVLVKRKEGMHVLPSKYVFRVKNEAPKARLVVLGCRQVHGLDYWQTFAPVVKMTSIRFVLALVAAMDLECEQMDVVTAFLNGDLQEEIYMEIPQGLRTKENENYVCKLRKALYGLKQAPRQWYAKIHNYLVGSLGFKSSVNDPCLYIRHKLSNLTIIALYVDDLLIAGNDIKSISSVKRQLSNIFEMKDLGKLHVMLGIHVERCRQKKLLFISQPDYVQTILHRFDMQDSNPMSTPMINSEPAMTMSNDVIDIPYRQAIGSLMYLMVGTRPDIAFAICRLAQYSENPTEEHWIAVKRVFRYIKGTHDYGILYDGNIDLNIYGYSDSDHGGCKNSRKSTSGYVFMASGGAISWRSKKQTSVATSSCEAEYIASCLASKEAIWLSRLHSDLIGKPSADPIRISIDNQGTIDLASNSIINDRSKHIDIQYHFIRECIHQKKISLSSCPSKENAADPLTKPLHRVKHSYLTGKQGVVSKSTLMASLKGEC